MKAFRGRWTVAVVVLLVLLSGCNALNEAATSEVTKEPAAIERAYASAYPLQATYSSTTVGEPKWYRPLYDLGGWYVPMTEIYELPYHVQAFRVATDGPYSVFSTQWFDGYLYLYGGGFDPTDQLVGLLTGNDDYMAIVGYSLIEHELVSGTTYYIVTTGYSFGTAGAFTNDIYGPGAVTLGDANPVDATNDLIVDVEQLAEDGVLKSGQAKGLVNPLENALRSLEKEYTADACNQFADFVMEVEAKAPPLTETQADELIDSADAIRKMIGCE